MNFSSWPCAWNFPLKIFYYNGDTSNEETSLLETQEVGPKKAAGLLQEQ